MRNELFTATRGQGAQLNATVCAAAPLAISTVLFWRPAPVQSKTVRHYLHQHRRQTVHECADFRRTGSAALDLAYVAGVVLTVSLKSVCARGISRQAAAGS